MNDVVYLWKVLNVERNGKYLCKIGSTSRHLKDYRIFVCANSANVTAHVLIKAFAQVGTATSAESSALKIGQVADIGNVDGKSEYRWLTLEQIDEVARHLRAHDQIKRVYRRDELVNDYREVVKYLLERHDDYMKKLVPWYHNLLWWVLSFVAVTFLIFDFGYMLVGSVFLASYFCISRNLSSNESNKQEAQGCKSRAEEIARKHIENIECLKSVGRVGHINEKKSGFI